jgi:acyl-CoA reductase-like NAD-dependent aldehyde dehydrogenase
MPAASRRPLAGYGKSGYGREKGREALWNYVQTKNVAIGENDGTRENPCPSNRH